MHFASPRQPSSGSQGVFVSPRQLSVLRAAQADNPGRDLVVDLSQSMERARVRTDGACPTITPGAVIHVERLGRIMLPIEKLMLHGFPIDLMGIPASTENSVLASLSGNTMHVKSVALALLVGIVLTHWGSGSSFGSGSSAHPATPEAVFPLGGKAKRKAGRMAGQASGKRARG